MKPVWSACDAMPARSQCGLQLYELERSGYYVVPARPLVGSQLDENIVVRVLDNVCQTLNGLPREIDCGDSFKYNSYDIFTKFLK